jgi:hypothetical protein
MRCLCTVGWCVPPHCVCGERSWSVPAVFNLLQQKTQSRVHTGTHHHLRCRDDTLLEVVGLLHAVLLDSFAVLAVMLTTVCSTWSCTEWSALPSEKDYKDRIMCMPGTEQPGMQRLHGAGY